MKATNPREVGMLFNGEMVRAILAGKKTQTRRPVKYIPALGEPAQWCHRVRTDSHVLESIIGDYRRFAPVRPGDVLWVRETWRTDASLDNRAPRSFKGWPVEYLADGEVLKHGSFFGKTNGKKRPSLLMPRWACRTLLLVVSVRCERVEDITEADAIAEAFPSADEYVAWWKSAYPGKEWCWVYEWKEAVRV